MSKKRKAKRHVEQGWTVLITRKDGTRFFSRGGMTSIRRNAADHRKQMIGDIDAHRMKVVKIVVSEA